MTLDRRNFLKFAAGGVAGTMASPLPWKLMDDMAIWTQNWPWMPVPPAGEFTHVKSVCHLCPGGCGIEVRKVDTRAVKIEGRTDYPVNPGGLCPVGVGGLQLLYNENIRYPSPMRRVGERGSGKYIPVTWREALLELTVRISFLRTAGKPEALVAVNGNPPDSTISLLIERLTKAVGSPNYMMLPALDDTYRMGNLLMQGTEGPMAYDLENADFVLSFGSGLLEGWGAPGRVMNAWRLLREKALGGKAHVVQVESRASNTASKADEWIPARPGTDGALALGLAHEIIKNGWNDASFLDSHCFGFSDWNSTDGKDHAGFKTMVLNRYTPDKVAQITGISSQTIHNLAKDFAHAKAPVAIYGKGKGSLNGSLYEFMTVQSLNALVGNINRPGGVVFPDPLPLNPLPDMKPDTVASEGLHKPRLDQAMGLKYPFAKSLIHNFVDTVLENREPPLDTLLIFSANPVYTLPDGSRFKKALEKIPFVVSFSPFKDETSYMADLILPDHTYLEKTDDIVWPSGLQYPLYGLSKPVVEPLYDTRHSGDVILQLAKRVGQSIESAFPWEGYEEILKTRAKGLFEAGGGLISYDGIEPAWKWKRTEVAPKSDYDSYEDMWAKIKSGGLWYRPVNSTAGYEKLFRTPTHKFEFFSTRLELAVKEYAQNRSQPEALRDMGISTAGDDAFMPHYEEAPFQIERSSYPLTMVPYDMINLASGWVPNPPYIYKTIFDDQLLGNESFATINPATAIDYGLKQGDRVAIQSPMGQVGVRVNLSEGAMPGIVYLPMGFGHSAYDAFIRGKGVNPNDIIQAREDPLSGQTIWWYTPVRFVKV